MKILVKIIILIIIFSSSNLTKVFAQEKIKLGLLVPISGEFHDIGKSIIKSTLLAINKINNPSIEIIPKDTESNPDITYIKAKELRDEGVKIVIGPVFNKNLIKLEELSDMIFLSLTNKIIDNPKNIISTGINASSQLNTIVKFQKNNELKKTIFLIPNKNYKNEIKKAIKKSKVNTFKIHYYDSDPTKLTKQIEKITKYRQRKQNVEDEIKRLKKSEDPNKEKKIKILEKKDTIGKIGFDSLIIADFDESLKSITTSLLYTDVSPKKIYFITLNQWFDESLLKETSYQPIYYPSINKENYDEFKNIYFDKFNQYPNQLSFLSYDLVGLVYYLIFQNNWIVNEKIFSKKNKFKGKVGIFEINDKKINHVLNFYKIENRKIKKIF
ncbi:MAG: hypothetical protein CBE28_02110 [Pelagibacteraceae bacterium TMED268]|nr:MAG: hypothetical protein CBE28_02110 [Pelagibacteraceae bacterium TMED268]